MRSMRNTRSASAERHQADTYQLPRVENTAQGSISDRHLAGGNRAVLDGYYRPAGGGGPKLRNQRRLRKLDDHRFVCIGEDYALQLLHCTVERRRTLPGRLESSTGGQETQGLDRSQPNRSSEVVGHLDDHLILVDVGDHEVTRAIPGEATNEYRRKILCQLVPVVIESLNDLIHAGTRVGNEPRQRRQ